MPSDLCGGVEQGEDRNSTLRSSLTCPCLLPSIPMLPVAVRLRAGIIARIPRLQKLPLVFNTYEVSTTVGEHSIVHIAIFKKDRQQASTKIHSVNA